MRNLIPWICLTRSGVRPLRLHTLLQRLGTPEAILGSSATQLIALSGMAPSAAERLLALADDPCEADLSAMARLSVELLTWSDERYPALLREIADPPCALYLRGTLSSADRISVAVVGTRRASGYGRDSAGKLCGDLARAGVTVVSGLAVGIDTAAHRGALAAGGRTLAVLGCGIDVPYPAANARLREEIVAGGALLSEFPMGSGPEPWHFPARNRIVSGLTLGTLVVEGDMKSGALITAEFASEQGREVFAVPGEVRNMRAVGPHRLIQDGAKLVHDVEDILLELRIVSPPTAKPNEPELAGTDLTDDETAVLKVLGPQQRHVDEVIGECGLPAGDVTGVLLMLEVKGLVRKLAGNAYIRLAHAGVGGRWN
jgi:DNA processing protein